MTTDQEKNLVKELREYIKSHFLHLETMSDAEFEERIEELVNQRIGSKYCSLDQRASICDQIYSSIRGLGLLDTLLKDPGVTEIMINGPDNIFIEKNGRLMKSDECFADEKQLLDIIVRVVSDRNRSVSTAKPIVDVQLSDGSRLNVVLPPIALCGPTMTIRKFSKTPMSIDRLIEFGSLTQDIAQMLEKLVQAKYNIFISGGTGSGKTTFLNALSNYIPKDERIITIEDSAELKIVGIDNLVSMQTRDDNMAGEGLITMQQLIKTSLRMRPDRIVVGEVRGGEALDMLQAMNTGHDGSLSTGHANSCKDMLLRLETMVFQGTPGLPLEAIRMQIASAIDIVIHLSRLRDKSRKVVEIAQVVGYKDGQIEIEPLFKFTEDENTTPERVSGALLRTDNTFKKGKKLENAGIKVTI